MTAAPRFCAGDKVVIRFDDRRWIPARVIRGHHPNHGFRRRQVRVILCLPELMSVNNGKRFLPIGTPMFWDSQSADVRLIDHDPGWNPHTVTPFLTPDEYEIIGGSRDFPIAAMPGMTQLGAYAPSTYYETGDPVWVWEKSWRAATVISASESWIRVSYRSNFRDGRGHSAKSYQPPNVWPAICDHSAPTRELLIDVEWAKDSAPGPRKRSIARYIST
ncbi:hypothetical protein ACFWNN_44960 [Lentzea sp. NPDC058450]|uniref:hypothetical protein n=1 Tax=Lentzea sp. NPDC058450 TaxID=3346505 RepID=UPI00365F8679